MKHHTLSALALVACLAVPNATHAADDYAMYVWKTGFDATVPGCDETKLLAWDDLADPECYTHNWESPASRQWLWDTANRPGRAMERLFIADIKPKLEAAYFAGDCSDPDVLLVKGMLKDGHCKAPTTKLHALLSTSDVAVSEQDHIKYVVWYNDTCAATPAERFDGIAVNNEAWNDVKCTTSFAEQAYLDDLQSIVDEAALQINGTLETHYSIGWKWSFCDSVEVNVDWDGTDQPVTYHMIDIFDSVDVQIAHVSAATVASRATTAGYVHAIGQGKSFYVLSYINKSSLSECTVTHFPFDCVAFPWSNAHRTDAYLMTQVFDQFAAEGIPDAKPAIHFFRGVYGSGAHVDWPSYWDGSVDTCIAVAFAGPVEFADLDDDNVISWPSQDNATVYEIARMPGPIFGQGCRIVGSTPLTSFRDQERPQPGGMYAYLVRIAEPNPSDWGTDSERVPRMFECF